LVSEIPASQTWLHSFLQLYGLTGGAENARLENAGLELSAPNCRGGKCIFDGADNSSLAFSVAPSHLNATAYFSASRTPCNARKKRPPQWPVLPHAICVFHLHANIVNGQLTGRNIWSRSIKRSRMTCLQIIATTIIIDYPI